MGPWVKILPTTKNGWFVTRSLTRCVVVGYPIVERGSHLKSVPQKDKRHETNNVSGVYFLWIVNRLFTCFYLMVLWFPTFDLFWFYGVDWWPCWSWPINSGPRGRSDFWIQLHLAIVVFPSFFCSSLVVGHPQLGMVPAESTHGKPAERHQLSYGLPRNKWSWIYIYTYIKDIWYIYIY